MGTIINAVAVVSATLLGIVFRKQLSEPFQKAILTAMGIGLGVLALGWFLKDFLVITGTSISTRFELIILLSIVIGAAVGEWIDLDGRFTRFVDGMESKYKLPPLAKGFINASLIFCVGAMAILGSFQDGLTGDYSILLMKSILDFITAMMLAALLGIGVALSAITILVYQGVLTLLATVLAPVIQGDLLLQITLIGNLLLIPISLNFLGIKSIKVANWLPALLGPVVVALANYFLSII